MNLETIGMRKLCSFFFAFSLTIDTGNDSMERIETDLGNASTTIFTNAECALPNGLPLSLNTCKPLGRYSRVYLFRVQGFIVERSIERVARVGALGAIRLLRAS